MRNIKSASPTARVSIIQECMGNLSGQYSDEFIYPIINLELILVARVESVRGISVLQRRSFKGLCLFHTRIRMGSFINFGKTST